MAAIPFIGSGWPAVITITALIIASARTLLRARGGKWAANRYTVMVGALAAPFLLGLYAWVFIGLGALDRGFLNATGPGPIFALILLAVVVALLPIIIAPRVRGVIGLAIIFGLALAAVVFAVSVTQVATQYVDFVGENPAYARAAISSQGLSAIGALLGIVTIIGAVLLIKVVGARRSRERDQSP
ncbi:MAG TPA: hypothetical protein VI893_01080 [Thermoplasmata archaeon]|nr:hypothetical protein [Thermoplasmata archaeon]